MAKSQKSNAHFNKRQKTNFGNRKEIHLLKIVELLKSINLFFSSLRNYILFSK